MHSFQDMFTQATQRFGSEDIVESLLPRPISTETLVALPDDRYLAQMSRRVFQAGFKHSVINKKWVGFEQAFHGFHPEAILMMPDEEYEKLASDKRIIRHWGNIQSVRKNAVFVQEIAAEYGSFGQFVGHWPVNDIVGLWAVLKKRGTRMGGNSAARFLRMVGKDTFLITPDTSLAMRNQGIIEAENPTSKRDLRAIQDAFNQWHQQSGRALCQISQLLAFTVNHHMEEVMA